MVRTSPSRPERTASIGPVVEGALELPDLAATEALGRRLAAVLGPGDVVALRAALGVGKTALARAVIRARVAVAIDVPSPTFTLVQDYSSPGLTVRHIDLYRIAIPDELVELGLEAPAADEAWLVEWPERAGSWLPADRLDVVLTERPAASEVESRAMPEPVAASRRVARLVAGPSWRARLSRLLET